MKPYISFRYAFVSRCSKVYLPKSSGSMISDTKYTRLIILYALEILKDTYAYPYGAEAYNCNNYNLL